MLLAQAAPDRTGGIYNGRWWARQDIAAKIYYVTGLGDGMQYAAPTDNPPVWPKMSYGEIVRSVDQFYGEPVNGAVPVAWTMLYIDKKLKGASEDELQRMQQFLRKVVVRVDGAGNTVTPKAENY